MDLKYIFALFVSFMIPELNVCLTCFSCSGVADLNSCDATITCGQGQSCSLEMDVSGQTTSYTLGCKDTQICDTHPGLIGRDLSCHECCSTDNCNKHICKPSTLKLLMFGIHYLWIYK
ncbi:uncharacterized protein LOC132752639 [Ruditapes philippinarum]|uniref:uncharacterized protein LOC132752639 n=1 Tax=Ruditapes philippinarum TaxID=129788 RepID=UPI00295B5D86|nr:uncharacterized protein LOC132752639 [Ruditapes philippinarum]